jgi:hypothetical protein
MNKRLAKHILDSITGYRSRDFIFYKHPLGDVVSGFAVDVVPSGFQVFKYTLPLYIKMNNFNLNYSVPICDDAGFFYNSRDVEHFFPGIVSKYGDEMFGLRKAESFLSHVKDLLNKQLLMDAGDEYKDLRSVDLRYCYAQTLVMLNKKKSALGELDLVLHTLNCHFFGGDRVTVIDLSGCNLASHDIEFISDVIEVRNMLIDGSAKDFLLNRRMHNIAKFEL